MRRLSPLLAVLLVILLLGSDSPKDYDDRTEYVGIEGMWRLTAYEFGGRKVKLPFQVVLIYRDETFVYKRSDGDTTQGNYRIDPSRNPAPLDLIPSSGNFKGQTHKWIYQINNDT